MSEFNKRNNEHKLYKNGEEWFIYCSKTKGTYKYNLNKNRCLCCKEILK